ncbi:amidohydrolase family protein [Saccharothrix sp. NRRL B-16348]|uniref:amidohydrolase family protein n=1 Tax=Saccharothrix sp. NRRL B-16348 TaxID=1415542 RepID=UPI000A8385D9|nr:amidohydrolase family protein [Saccharothrix sp. NRRL B-16348]
MPGLVDVHVHFMPQRVLDKVWAFFDEASRHYGVDWSIRYRLPEAERLAALRSFGVVGFAPLVYPHKPGMGEWLTDWALDFGSRVDGAVPTATLYPEPGVEAYVARALSAGARCFKAHVQVGGYDPRSLDGAWGLLADARVPVVVHCGHGPVPGAHTGLDVFEDVLRRHPSLVAVVAHAGMPDYLGALDLVARYDGVHLDTTMVGVPFTEARAALPGDWAARLVDVADRVVLGSDFPNIPYDYSAQLNAIEGWAAADDRLGEPFLRAVLHDNGARLLGLSPG